MPFKIELNGCLYCVYSKTRIFFFIFILFISNVIYIGM
jgi:hypothetical protein